MPNEGLSDENHVPLPRVFLLGSLLLLGFSPTAVTRVCPGLYHLGVTRRRESPFWKRADAQVHLYTANFFDCDAYPAVFVGFALWNFKINGFVRVLDSGAHHSYNAVLICDDGKTCSWEEIEPQSDTFVDDPPKGVTVTVPNGAYAAQTGFAALYKENHEIPNFCDP